MSATGRGKERRVNDFYETPAWPVRRYLDARALVWPGDRWIEPSAGRGAIIRAVDGWTDAQCVERVKWSAIELDPKFMDLINTPRKLCMSFLAPELTAERKFDLCMGNPPYKLAQEFIEKGLTVARKVAYLLRLNFLESGKRFKFFKSNPCDVFVLPNRPSFYQDGHTDATAYGWFEFGEGVSGKISILSTTPKAERLADRVQAA